MLRQPPTKNRRSTLFPSATLFRCGVVAITGTNGKTSCVQWVAQALTDAGKPCGSIGTLGALLPDGSALGGNLTTPDVLSVHRIRAAMCAAGAQAVALEASSTGPENGGGSCRERGGQYV